MGVVSGFGESKFQKAILRGVIVAQNADGTYMVRRTDLPNNASPWARVPGPALSAKFSTGEPVTIGLLGDPPDIQRPQILDYRSRLRYVQYASAFEAWAMLGQNPYRNSKGMDVTPAFTSATLFASHSGLAGPVRIADGKVFSCVGNRINCYSATTHLEIWHNIGSSSPIGMIVDMAHGQIIVCEAYAFDFYGINFVYPTTIDRLSIADGTYGYGGDNDGVEGLVLEDTICVVEASSSPTSWTVNYYIADMSALVPAPTPPATTPVPHRTMVWEAWSEDPAALALAEKVDFLTYPFTLSASPYSRGGYKSAVMGTCRTLVCTNGDIVPSEGS